MITPAGGVRVWIAMPSALVTSAALLAVVLAAGMVGTGQPRLDGRHEVPASPSTRPRFPAKLADYAATVANPKHVGHGVGQPMAV